ncbi:hypothetical protein PUNSTDRAFT_138982 [Punctularia strigosozonata HHB-11173 SS5]|uniref:Uncharacterized protein n=1 Tax=Punctularia strigosozonata (strain HHB-11173) TaxID=741275 RepID=R7S141_PUNST|nr:uncharacterized protein PUNSTDRAFT_138982 [Punctularia strigosozonata HHB-11173 SS5]EIN03938.1 hypothetical protein PUNSTDRAFT_138982 [Punctularia strigosozonata HHB-11173 SS5]
MSEPGTQSNGQSYRPRFYTAYRTPRTNEEAQNLYNHIRTIAYALDSLSGAIPGLDRLPFDVGLEAVIGAILPVAGDFIGALAGLYVIYLCWLFGVGNWILGQMIVNVIIDAVVGIIPFVGDVLDVAWKSNMRNLGLLEDFLVKSAKRGGFQVQVAPPYQWNKNNATSGGPGRSASSGAGNGLDWTSILGWFVNQARSNSGSGGRFGGW